MADVYNFDNFQIPAVGVGGGMENDQQGRNFDAKISNFGALNYGNRDASDYTKVSLGFKNKDEWSNPTLPPFTMDAEYNENPYVWGSTVKRVRDEEFAIMGIGNRRSNSATNAPSMDTMDTNVAVDDGTNAPKKFPMEGWSTFGGRTGGPFGV